MNQELLYTRIQEETKEIRMAKKILDNVCSTMKTKVHVLIPILNTITFVPVKEEIKIGTNGTEIFYHPASIIKLAKFRLFGEMEDTILHILLHGILGHFEEHYWKKKELMWAVEDIQVYRYMQMFKEANENRIRQKEKEDVSLTELMENYMKDELYFEGMKNKTIRKRIKKTIPKCRFEDHRLWDPFLQKAEAFQDGRTKDSKEEKKAIWQETRDLLFGNGMLKEEEKEQILQTKLEKQKRTKVHGSTGLQLENEVELEEGNINSYQALLEEITSLSEQIHEEQEIDKVLYQYGLELYGDVPLVEPEELNEKYCLHTLVIAVDTSGSCTPMAKKFLQELVAIFEEIKKIGKIEHICYLECDAEITKQKSFYEIDEFTAFGKKHSFHGGGGTDFTPVFEYTDGLVRAGEQVDALFYITDGDGEFPFYEEVPPYKVYFLLDQYEEEDIISLCRNEIPDWVECVNITE